MCLEGKMFANTIATPANGNMAIPRFATGLVMLATVIRIAISQVISEMTIKKPKLRPFSGAMKI